MARVIDPLVHDFMIMTSKNLFNAAQSGDVDLAEAVMVKFKTQVDSYINALHSEGETNGTNKR